MSQKSVGEVLGLITRQSYSDQLGSSEWAAFSARIRSSHGYTCEICRLGGKITQVHHPFYDPSRKLWEYAPDEVMVLCSECHGQMHEQLKLFRRFIFRHLKPSSFIALNKALAIGVLNNDEIEFAYAVMELACDGRLVKNFCRAWTERKKEPDAAKVAPHGFTDTAK